MVVQLEAEKWLLGEQKTRSTQYETLNRLDVFQCPSDGVFRASGDDRNQRCAGYDQEEMHPAEVQHLVPAAIGGHFSRVLGLAVDPFTDTVLLGVLSGKRPFTREPSQCRPLELRPSALNAGYRERPEVRRPPQDIKKDRRPTT
jgi:hypothetical protein